MSLLIKAELRKLLKTKKFFIAIVAFLCLMACSYALCLQKGEAYHYEEGRQLTQNYRLYNARSKELKQELKTYKTVKDEPKGLRKEYEIFTEAAQASSDYLYMRQAPEYFGWKNITKGLNRYSKALQAVEAYQPKISQQEAQDLKNDITLYSYLQEHDIQVYSSPFEPNLMNFFVQMFQNDSIILLIIISAFFIIDQICQDFDYGSYKNVYIVPLPRAKIMASKIISAAIMMILSLILAFAIFSFVPMMTYGIGSAQYMYIFNHQLVGYFSYMAKVLPFLLLIVLVYLTSCVLLSNLFKNTTNTMLVMAGTLIAVYLCVKFFGLHPSFTWLPLFYLYPMEIMFGIYPYPWYICVMFSVITLILMYVFFKYRLEKADLKGSEAS